MTSYRRQVHHPLAVERAKRQARRHAWETQGYGRGYVAETVKGLFLDFADRFNAMNLHLTEDLRLPDHQRVAGLAYEINESPTATMDVRLPETDGES